jgi:hypothetical protein
LKGISDDAKIPLNTKLTSLEDDHWCANLANPESLTFALSSDYDQKLD